MKKKNREKLRLITLRVCIGVLCAFVIAVFIRSYYYRSKESNLDIKSRYTFTVDIDAYGDVIDEQYQTRAAIYDDSNIINTVPDVSQVKTETVARTWLNEYVNQYMNEYLPYNKSVKRMTIDDINVLNEDEHTALISFSVILKNAASDYFLSWDGVTDDDRLKCEWVVSYYIDAHTDNTATVYVTSALSPEEYGIAQYNEKAALAADSENKTNASTDLLARYVIRDDILSVTYDDGEHYATVPVDVENLMYESGSTSTLKDGSYLITTSKTAFLFGGRMGSSKKVPVTLIYSDDKGVNWTSCELDNIYNAEDYYVDFFDENKGVIVCGYARTDNEKESYRIYQTANGCEESLDTVEKISKLPGLEVEGIFTHFARADEKTIEPAREPFRKYMAFVEELEKRGVKIPIHHVSNSASIIGFSEANLDMVRSGITTYGLYPSNEVAKDVLVLEPAMQWKSIISYIKTVEPGTSISYGGTFTAKEKMTVATIPVGYADGMKRDLSGKGRVLIHGQYAPILGRICMDQFMVDVSHIKEAAIGDTVTIFGKDGEKNIPVEEIAEKSHSFNYEFVCSITNRVPRKYLGE